ncbi:histidine phosphatase family protein [Williamsia herbipolensis]|uniref:Histidine phosphatase family protein n=1 Tax=Williamsia herbipolensis TaxID=1603258 RepID=A0AAU4K797_9NOCA|nr:histidine phosphatase family protein [Williamsia herbipolensis]
MTDIIMVRHARTEGNVRGLLQGRADSPVIVDELAAAAAWRERGLPEPDAVYCSPQRRARITAAYLLPDVAAVIDDRLAERDLGDIDGRVAQDLWAAEPDLAHAMAADPTFAPPGGESAEQVGARVRGLVGDLVRRGDRLAACVTHGALMTITLRVLAGVEGRPHIENLQAVRLRVLDPAALHPVELVGVLPGRTAAAVAR